MAKYNILEDILSFLKSFESLVDMTNKSKIKLSYDDIYYIEYCKVKAENLLMELENNKDIRKEVGVYAENLRIIINQINLIEKVVDKDNISDRNKIDDSMTYGEYSTREIGNVIYAETFYRDFRERDGLLYHIIDYSLLSLLAGVGIWTIEWRNITKVLTWIWVYAVSHIVLTGGIHLAILTYNKIFRFKKTHMEKVEFNAKVLYKIILTLDKKEYMKLYKKLLKTDATKRNIYKLYYNLAKIELLGEYVNRNWSYKNYTEDENEAFRVHTDKKYEVDKYIEDTLVSICNRLDVRY